MFKVSDGNLVITLDKHVIMYFVFAIAGFCVCYFVFGRSPVIPGPAPVPTPVPTPDMEFTKAVADVVQPAKFRESMTPLPTNVAELRMKIRESYISGDIGETACKYMLQNPVDNVTHILSKIPQSVSTRPIAWRLVRRLYRNRLGNCISCCTVRYSKFHDNYRHTYRRIRIVPSGCTVQNQDRFISPQYVVPSACANGRCTLP